METTNPRIDRALAVVDRELARTRTEQDAFERFIGRLSRLEVSERQVAGTTPRPNGSARSCDLADRIETAYRETVMSTPHYDQDYGDPFEQEVSEEFGPEVAQALTALDTFGAVHYEAVYRSAEESLAVRSNFETVLERERSSLAEIDARLGEIESEAVRIDDSRPGRMSSDTREGLLALEASCDRLSTRRQEEIHDRSTADISGIAEASLVTYLYGGFEVTCPALADIASVYETVRERRRRHERRSDAPA